MPKRNENFETMFNGHKSTNGKSRAIKLKDEESIIEINSVQLPFIAKYKGEKLKSIYYKWINRTGKPGQRGIFVSGHEEFGVPTLRDLDILAALQSIFIKNKTKNDICILKTEFIFEEDLTIDFTINALSKELGYKSFISNEVRNNIKNSIETLLETNIVNCYDGGIYNIKRKNYIKDTSTKYKYIERCPNYYNSNTTDNLKLDNISKIKLNRFFYDMIINGHFLVYNREKLRLTNNLTARKLYLLISLWMHNKSSLTVSIDDLIEFVPVAQSELKYQRQYIKKALNILHERKIFNILNLPDNKCKIEVI
ncbi:hypothetical protein [Clostridium butyricum]|uniref:hypothetical protein n=1 Tax=Clostridium butyricum TaxID=1492 RepID=UPI00325B1701